MKKNKNSILKLVLSVLIFIPSIIFVVDGWFEDPWDDLMKWTKKKSERKSVK